MMMSGSLMMMSGSLTKMMIVSSMIMVLVDDDDAFVNDVTGNAVNKDYNYVAVDNSHDDDDDT